jgi:hypothetical protein
MKFHKTKTFHCHQNDSNYRLLAPKLPSLQIVEVYRKIQSIINFLSQQQSTFEKDSTKTFQFLAQYEFY